ncbi:MAG: hypothetical protein ABI791_06160 [Acidobacteriota bacterium]
MKKALLLLSAVLLFAAAAFSQEKPLNQAEYVKMLLALQKNPAAKAEIVDALRKRGIDFVLTDGLRSLTRTKGANDDELKRALEEAARRRDNPSTAKPPTPVESAQILAKTRSNTLAAVEEMPDFVVKQQVQRSAAYAGTNNFRNLDRLVVAVSYKSTGEESYRVLSNNGVVNTNAQAKGSYEEVGGTSSTGEFVTMLATIFKPESEAIFEPVDTDLIRGRRAVIYDFSVTREKAKQIITATGYLTDSAVTGMKGRMWVDRDDFRVLRVESEATEIPESFPIRSAKRVIDYEWTTISQEKYLLPLVSDVRLTFRENSKVFETRNLIRFKDYQKYGTDVQIVEEDNAPPEETTPPAPQKP